MDSTVESASLILTSIALLYSVWNSLFDEVRNYKTDRHYLDLKEDNDRSKEVLRTRSIPILIGSLLSALIFLPKVIDILIVSAKLNIQLGPIKSLSYYDIQSAALIIVELFLIALGIHLYKINMDIRKIIKSFDQARENYEKRRNAP